MKEQVLDLNQRVAVALVIESLKELYKRHLKAVCEVYYTSLPAFKARCHALTVAAPIYPS